MIAVLVFAGAALGAPLRYLTDRAVRRRWAGSLPWGTFLVNVAGSLLLGALTAATLPTPLFALLGTGFCGALTTYSTFSWETLRLTEEKAWSRAVLNAGMSVVAGVAAAFAGYALVAAVVTM